ncbi:protein WFDC10B-like [Oryctolagus cuniculus]|uniref:protein WFDC10B-like n=1 Tax=Oryctolagus cuniculus TaxID=9986 RepID=UPI003879DE7F
MKGSILQFLTFLSLVALPVSGTWKERVHPEIEFPDYILSRPKLSSCAKVPTEQQCRTFCKLPVECRSGHYCCTALCGNICMRLE